MDPIYPRYARSSSLFYDRPSRATTREGAPFQPTGTLDWRGWLRMDDGHWTSWTPTGTELPDQGWKIHVSATPSSAPEALARASAVCHSEALPYKHLSSPGVLFEANSKDADRSASGKFITIYPPSESGLLSILERLDRELSELPGPYILSDLRWNSGPIYVRYGGFVKRSMFVDGIEELALRRPDGRLVPDIRSASFVIPDWIDAPNFLLAQQAALASDTIPEEFPSVARALHHSNAGGVYEAAESDGTLVVLKEARPHAGLTPDGRDAPARLRAEFETLRQLDHLGSVVKARRIFEVHGHSFLVMEHVMGRSLHEVALERYPLLEAEPSPAQLQRYRDWALAVSARVRSALQQVHDAGFTHGDLHPRNVMLGEHDEVVLIDFEMAQPLGCNMPALIGAPGFVPPDARAGVASDHWALSCIRLFLFAPLTSLIALDPRKAADLARWAADVFDLSPDWVQETQRELRYAISASALVGVIPDDISRCVDAIATSITSDVSLERLDRLWPGDPQQFAESPAALAHGAGGVLLALNAAGVPAPAGSLQWFNSAADRLCEQERPALGLMDGVAGVAWARLVLGDAVGADRAFRRLFDSDVYDLGPGLYRGSSGVGLSLLEAGVDDAYLQICVSIADHLARQLRDTARLEAATAATGQAGLMNGWSGAAFFAARLFKRTGDERHMRLAELALQRDLAVCKFTEQGSLFVDEGWRLVPYLGSGSAGIAMVLSELITSAGTSRYAELTSAVTRAVAPAFVAFPGLLQGRAGLIHALLTARDVQPDDEIDTVIDRHVRLLSLHAIRRPDGLSFPGHGLLRLSCDLATGSAGVLTALVAFRNERDHGQYPLLPFLSSSRSGLSGFAPTFHGGGGDEDGSYSFAAGARTA